MAVRETLVRTMERPFLKTIFTVILLLLAGLVACSKPQPQPQPEAVEAPKTTGLEHIPAADPSKYPRLSNLGSWQNPNLVVREDGIGIVDLSNREIHILTQEEIPAELATLPLSAWPYGRAVLITQAVPKNLTPETKADLRKNRALLLGTLKELDVQYFEAP